VRFFTAPPAPDPVPTQPAPRFDPGAVIGKCENILSLTFILAGEATGLALIFAAKSIVRKDEIQKNPSYYLGGTLVNLVWAVLVGFAMRAVLALDDLPPTSG
jgi:hypothetical protein